MLSYLRARAVSAGFLGGSRFWIGLGAIVWTIRFCQWLVRPETEVIYREKLGSGQSVTIRHNDPLPSKRKRKKAAKRAEADAKAARKQARRDRRAARKGRSGAEAAVPSESIAA
jgi:hypothetical protein